MPVWRVIGFAVLNGLVWGMLVTDQPKSLILSGVTTAMWLVTFDRD